MPLPVFGGGRLIAAAKTGPRAPDAASPPPSGERLYWLDVTRVLAALMVAGIHWLREAYRVGLFGAGRPTSIVMDTQEHTGGAAALAHSVLIAGTGPSLAVWLTNLMGLLGAFGWEAVSAMIVISGFSLTLAQRNASLAPAAWWTWFGKRARRILVPYYLIALPILAAGALLVFVLPTIHGTFAANLDAKLLSQFHTPPLGVLLSHLILIDPWGFTWGADFIAPAWWFVPAILLAYAAYPFVRAAARVGGGVPLLVGTACLSILAFSLKERGILENETWYYIVLQESFDFSLGVVLAFAWMGSGRARLERLMVSPWFALSALAVFALGNVMNWTPQIRPAACLFYGPSCLALLVVVAKLLERRRIARVLTSFDAYDLYLVHQPFAFPIALVAKALFHSYGVFLGWFVFLGVAAVATKAVSAAQRAIFAAASARRSSPA